MKQLPKKIIILFALLIFNSSAFCAQYLKQSTAVTVKIGPFLDYVDGDTAETGLTISQADVRLSKNGGDIAQKTESSACTHDELGVYDCPLDATDTDTLGRLQLWVHESGALLVWHEYMVVPANVYDSMFSTDKLQVDVTQIEGGDASDAINAEADTALGDYDGPTNAEMEARTIAAASYFDPSGDPVANVTTVATLTGHTPQTGDSYAIVNNGTYGNSAIKGFVDDIGVAGAGLTAIPWNAAWNAEAESECADALIAINLDHLCAVSTGGADMSAEVVDYSILSRILANGDTSAFVPSTDAIRFIRLAADAIKAKTDNLPTDPADDSDIDTQLAAIAAYLDTEIAAILADSNELQTDWANGGRLDLLIDAIKVVLDKLDTAMELDVDIYRFTENALEMAPAGEGGGDGLTQQEVRDAMKLAASAGDPAAGSLDKKLDDIQDGSTGEFVGSDNSLKAIRDRGDVAWLRDSGAGATEKVYTVTDGLGQPVDGASVWVTTDETGLNVVASGTTDANGQVTFYLDAGTYYIWTQKAGYNFDNPDEEEIE